ncbi:uncharacterized protein LOC118198714 [Stegodyphus dumicola]|uniref:uncharacterized protein LOC118198714 n=1 Tax=Stegodyphus dumicola TaxID=202533 RepID=UPI0015A94AD2|nr:uncharacterized protein LOC118198714 [Stegodyphus dumicola]
MSIKPSLEYIRSGDEFVGTVDMGGLEKELGIEDKLANRLLSFVFVGLFTYYRLPVSCFFTKELKGAELYKITLNFMKELEDLDFKVIRLVADNSKGVPCSMLIHVQHYFWLENSKFVVILSSKYVRNLYELQNKDVIKIVRNLSRKHVYPSSFEKMNVRRAVQLFSSEMTAGLRVLQKYGP